MKNIFICVVVVLLIACLLGCGSMKKRDQGALIGAGAGAVIGGIIGDKAGNTAVGAILGAMVGGAAGAYIGNYMDKQAEEMRRDLEGATIERIGEGIKITFDSGILFDIDKSAMRPEAMANLKNLAVILNKYEDTEVLIEGHTDATGPDEHNRELSIRRLSRWRQRCPVSRSTRPGSQLWVTVKINRWPTMRPPPAASRIGASISLSSPTIS